MDICFFVENIKKSLDYSNMEHFNPGIGGTQYLFLEVALYLSRNTEHIIHMYSNTAVDIGFDFDYQYVNDVLSVINICAEKKYDILVIRGPIYDKRITHEIENKNLKVIIWSHNFESYDSIKLCEKSPNIVKYICVGNEQRDLLLDTGLYEKTETIWNALNFDQYPKRDIHNPKKTVCYIGNLYPKSGYDNFAKAWMDIEKRIPDVELYIIGGNNLYTEDAFKGRYSKRSINRLRKTIEHAFYKNGKLKENIHFTGVLGGMEKLKIMQKATVGVANITVTGETFGLSLIEFEALGVPVVSIKYRGARETVCDGTTGILVKKNQLADGIIKLLQDDMLASQMGNSARNFVNKQFDIRVIGEQWIRLFDKVADASSGKEIIELDIELDESRFSYDGKNPILFNYNLKQHKCLSWLPSVSFYRSLYSTLLRIIEKLNLQ